MLADVPLGIEMRMRVAQHRGAGLQVMKQRMQSIGADIRVVLAVPRAVEEGVGIAALGQSVADEMQYWRQTGQDRVGIALLIPVGIEEACHHADQRNFARILLD